MEHRKANVLHSEYSQSIFWLSKTAIFVTNTLSQTYIILSKGAFEQSKRIYWQGFVHLLRTFLGFQILCVE